MIRIWHERFQLENSDLIHPPSHFNWFSLQYQYGVNDPEYSGAVFSQQENRADYNTAGEYRVNLPDGRIQIVTYTAGPEGYIADVKYEGVAVYAETAPYKPAPPPAYKPAPAPYKPAPVVYIPAPTSYKPAPTQQPYTTTSKPASKQSSYSAEEGEGKHAPTLFRHAVV